MKSVKSTSTRFLDIDEMLTLVGEYGRFQKIINLMFCITIIPAAYPLMIMYFAAKSPRWKCVNTNSTTCSRHNETLLRSDRARCAIPRSEWEYTTHRTYSIVTEFDLVCEREYLLELATSIMFFGFIFGASVIGWFADNFGRKKVHYISLSLVLTFSFSSIFVGHIYLFIACRFLVGFFLHGSFPQMALMISEIVGNDKRAFATSIMFCCGGVGFAGLALKAYFITSWRMLFVACTAPYVFVLAFYKFVPESVRFLRVKGKLDEAMLVFQRMAYWNNENCPRDVRIAPISFGEHTHKTHPVDLFRTIKMAKISSVIALSSFVNSMAFYCLCYAAGDITGHMYADFVAVSALIVPVSLLCTPLVNKYGRKSCSLVFLLISAFACVGLGFTPEQGKLKIVRIILAMLGNACIVGSGLSQSIWAMELFPTSIRGQGNGFAQVLNKIGATSSSWIDRELSKVHVGCVFIVIGGLNFLTVLLQLLLPETKGVNIIDTCTESKHRDFHADVINVSKNRRDYNVID